MTTSLKVKLHRFYPQLAHAVETLVQKYDQLSPNVSISAYFGKIHLSEGNTTSFDKNISLEIAKQSITMMQGFKNWKQVDDWKLSYNYSLTDGNVMCVEHQDHDDQAPRISLNCPSATIASEHVDFAYQQSENIWRLREYVTRVTFDTAHVRAEETVFGDLIGFENDTEDGEDYENEDDDDEEANKKYINSFSNVQMCLRKSFFYTGTSALPGVMFRYDLEQSWNGTSTMEVEQKAFGNEAPVISLAVSILNHRQVVLDEKDKYRLFLSLLLKMQDFLEYPVCSQLMVCPVNASIFSVMTTDEKKKFGFKKQK